VEVDVVSTGELLDAWRDAARAAELAERLAKAALRAAERAERDSATAEEVATLAEEVAASADRAALVARQVADDASAHVLLTRSESDEADITTSDARATEAGASSAYHEAEDEARRKHAQNGA
jgi:hypothetical protein